MAGNTPIADVVDAPTIGAVTDLGTGTSVSVAFTAATTGGAATSFGAISTPGSITGTSATSPITVSGLTADTAYTFKTYGINSSGTWSNVLSSSSSSITPVAPTFESIATVTADGSSGSMTASNIPGTYKHLQVRILARHTAADLRQASLIRLNNISSADYHWRWTYGADAAVYDNSVINSSYIGTTYVPGTGNNANIFAVFIFDILDYASTSKTKTVKGFTGFHNNTSTENNLGFTIGVLNSTAAITNFSFQMATAAFASGSSMSLYGIKGS